MKLPSVIAGLMKFSESSSSVPPSPLSMLVEWLPQLAVLESGDDDFIQCF